MKERNGLIMAIASKQARASRCGASDANRPQIMEAKGAQAPASSSSESAQETAQGIVQDTSLALVDRRREEARVREEAEHRIAEKVAMTTMEDVIEEAEKGSIEVAVDQAEMTELKKVEVSEAAERYRKLEIAGNSIFKKYRAAIREMRVRFEVLDDDLEARWNRNPIHHIEWRLKKAESVFGKLERYGKPVTLESMEENVLDIAGIRVICSYVDDVYNLVKMIGLQDDLEIIKVKDYIKNPKPNGYRSLHIIVKVPVYFLDQKELIPVEVQLRTIAMDFWASLEHTLKYKSDREFEGIDMFDELKNCSEVIEDVERRMQILMHAIQQSDAAGREMDAARTRRGEMDD